MGVISFIRLNSETIKLFLLFFCMAGIAILYINTYLMIENQSKILQNQEMVAKPMAIDNNERIKNIESMIGNISSSQEVK